MTWNPTLWFATKGEAHLRWLPDEQFNEEAKKYNIDISKDGFWVPKRWYMRHDLIVVRARALGVIPHEIRHVEEGYFHDKP